MRDGGYGHGEHACEVTHAKLGVVQDRENADARAVAKDLVELGQRKELLLRGEIGLGMRNQMLMQLDFFTVWCNFFQTKRLLSTFEQLFNCYCITAGGRSQEGSGKKAGKIFFIFSKKGLTNRTKSSIIGKYEKVRLCGVSSAG